MSKNKVLLVGAEGYIGSNCPFECDKVDIKSGKDFVDLKPQLYDTIIFLAARLGSTPYDFIYNETLYRALDEWLEIFPDIHIIYASSAAVYGESALPARENQLPWPINLYGRSKLAGEYRVREYANHTVLRFGNVYGKLKGRSGHGVTELFQSGQRTIFGDGEQVREFVTVETIWEIIGWARMFPEYWQGVTNVSMGRPVTINNWYKIHGQGDPQHIEPRTGDIYTSILDNTKMRERMDLCR